MTHSLTKRQEQIVSIIAKNPGATSRSIGAALGEKPNRIAAILFTILDHHRGVLVRSGTGGNFEPFTYRVANGDANAQPSGERIRRRSRRRHKAADAEGVDALLTLKYGVGETVTLTLSDAHEVYRQLHAIYRHWPNGGRQ